MCLMIMSRLLGWASFAGLVIMIASIPLNKMLLQRRIRLNAVLLQHRDRRTDLLVEMIQAVRHIKLAALDRPWLHRLFTSRSAELDQLRKLRLNAILMTSFWSYVPDLVMLVAFGLFVGVRGLPLTIAVAFPSIALFNLLVRRRSDNEEGLHADIV